MVVVYQKPRVSLAALSLSYDIFSDLRQVMQCPQLSPGVAPPTAGETLASFLCPGWPSLSPASPAVLPSFSASSYPFLPAASVLLFCAVPCPPRALVGMPLPHTREQSGACISVPVLVPLVIVLHRTRSCPGQWATRVSAATAALDTLDMHFSSALARSCSWLRSLRPLVFNEAFTREVRELFLREHAGVRVIVPGPEAA